MARGWCEGYLGHCVSRLLTLCPNRTRETKQGRGKKQLYWQQRNDTTFTNKGNILLGHGWHLIGNLLKWHIISYPVIWCGSLFNGMQNKCTVLFAFKNSKFSSPLHDASSEGEEWEGKCIRKPHVYLPYSPVTSPVHLHLLSSSPLGDLLPFYLKRYYHSYGFSGNLSLFAAG